MSEVWESRRGMMEEEDEKERGVSGKVLRCVFRGPWVQLQEGGVSKCRPSVPRIGDVKEEVGGRY